MGAVRHYRRPVGDYLVFDGQGKHALSAGLVDGVDVEPSGFLETMRV